MASTGNVLGVPRRRNPSHPPYALMIGTALRSLSEEGGSSREAISAYIVANYDGLPWGHDKLLPYYLQKLTEQGEFLAVAPGRYLIIGGDNEPRHVGDVHRTSEPKRDLFVNVRDSEAMTQAHAEAGTSSAAKHC